MNDLRLAVRSLMKSPGLLAVAVCSLGLGIAANSTLFAVFKSLFLDTPTLSDPGRMVRLRATDGSSFSYPHYLALQTTGGLAGLAGYSMARVNVRTGAEVQQPFAMVVTPGFFKVLGVEPAQGR